MKRTGPKTEDVYVDPSALSRLYVHQEGSREMAEWRARRRGPLPVTHHGRTEIVNAIALAVFRKHLTAELGEEAWSLLEDDFAQGNLRQADILWRASLDRAAGLSREFSPELGTRTLNVLHMACAMELGTRWFLTFDERQEAPAKSAGLRVVQLRAARC